MGHMGNGKDVMGNGEDVIMGDESLIYGYVKSWVRTSRLTASPIDPMDPLGARGYTYQVCSCAPSTRSQGKPEHSPYHHSRLGGSSMAPVRQAMATRA
jgi:hypothetical protein